MERNIRKILTIFLIIAIAIAVRFGLELAYNAVIALIDAAPFVGYATRTAFVLLLVIVWLTVALRSDSPTQKMPWLLLLLFEPVIGIALFLTFGRNFKYSLRYRRRPRIHDDSYITKEVRAEAGDVQLPDVDPDVAALFHASHRISYHQPFVDDTSVDVFRNGETFYPDLLDELTRAKRFILMEFFIVRSDTRGRQIIDLLMDKAAAGLEVKLIMDALGSSRINRLYLRKIKRSKIDLIINDKIYFPLFNTRINFRNHRKIVVIDGQVGYTGGMNLADEYDNSIDYAYYFRDTQVKLRGAAVKSLTSVFFKDYYYNTGTFIDSDDYYPKTQVKSQGIVQILQSGPDSHEAHIRSVYLKAIMTAKHSIRIMTPYMSLDQETLTALIIAKRSGVDVEVIIPGTPDKYLVYKVTQYFATMLLTHTIDVYRYVKGFSHAKVLIIDDKIASVGSYNMNHRSALIDFEITALFTGDAVQTVLDQYAQDKIDSEKIDPVAWKKRPIYHRLFEVAMSIFTPII